MGTFKVCGCFSVVQKMNGSKWQLLNLGKSACARLRVGSIDDWVVEIHTKHKQLCINEFSYTGLCVKV